MKIDDKQQKILDEFFVTKEAWNQESLGNHLGAGIIIGLGMLLLVLPFKIWEGAYRALWMTGYLLLMGISIYMKPYIIYRCNGKVKLVYDVIQYLSISHAQLHLYRMKKIAKMCAKLAVTAVTAQVFFCVVLHYFSIWVIVAPLFFTFVCPMGILGLLEIGRK